VRVAMCAIHDAVPPVQQSRTDASNENQPTHTKESNNLANIGVDLRYVTRYGSDDTKRYRHKGLKRLHEEDDPRGIVAEHSDKLRDILASARCGPDGSRYGCARLQTASAQRPGERFLGGNGSCKLAGHFSFADHDAFDVDYVDYH
jgi:proteic killer suppression protein